MSGNFILTTDGLYHTSNILTVAATLQSSFTGGLLLRRVAGVANAIAALRITENNLLFDFDFTADDGGWYPILDGNNYETDAGATYAQYSAGVGWIKGTMGDPGGGGTTPCWIAVDLGANIYISRLVGIFTASATPTIFDGAGIASEPDESLVDNDNALAPTGGTLDTGTVAVAAERYVRFQVNNKYSDGTITITNVEIYGQALKFRYSSDNGATETETTVGAYAGDTGMDTDDFNVGVKIAAAANKIYYGSSYTGAFSELTGLTGVAEGTQITCVRIPYRKLNTQSLNNNASSMQFIFGTAAAVSGKTLWGITFNASSGAIIAQSDMTPTIGSTTYYVIGPNALVTNGDNTQQIIAPCKPVGGGTTRLLKSSNGGSSWSDLGAVDGLYADIVPAASGGENGEYLIAGDVGLRHAASFNGSLQSRDGDFGSELAEAALGMVAL